MPARTNSSRAPRGTRSRSRPSFRMRFKWATRVTPLTFCREWMVQVAQGAGAPWVHLWRPWPRLCRNYVLQSSLDYAGLRGEGSTPVPLPPPASHRYYRDNLGAGKLRDISEG